MHKVPTEQVSPYELSIAQGRKPDNSLVPIVHSAGDRPAIRGPPPDGVAITYRISDAVAISGLSRSSIYKAIKNGCLHTVFVSGRRLVPASSLRQFLLGAA
jgi:hypothetical protein